MEEIVEVGPAGRPRTDDGQSTHMVKNGSGSPWRFYITAGRSDLCLCLQLAQRARRGGAIAIDIILHQAGKLGDRRVRDAREISRSGRSGITNKGRRGGRVVIRSFAAIPAPSAERGLRWRRAAEN